MNLPDIFSQVNLSRKERRNRLNRLEAIVRRTAEEAGAPPLAGIETDHQFAPGLYTRTMRAPAGTVAVGAIHKTESLGIILSGRLIVATEYGTREVGPGEHMIGAVGERRAAYFIEDTVWVGFHATDKTDLTEIRQEFIADSYDEIKQLEESKHGLGSDSNSG